MEVLEFKLETLQDTVKFYLELEQDKLKNHKSGVYRNASEMDQCRGAVRVLKKIVDHYID